MCRTVGPAAEAVREFVGCRLAGVHEHQGVAHPYLSRRGPWLLDVPRRGSGDPHLAVDARQPCPVEGGLDRRPDVDERFLAHIARHPHACPSCDLLPLIPDQGAPPSCADRLGPGPSGPSARPVGPVRLSASCTAEPD
ncbi:hypothetical protein [Streptomyces sp. NBC_01092]|uniref:hypothetical protein n=1 Tax=Streptomyces sp. NBC_01092 TaxID=2903748 RepID=UPI003863896E